MSSCIIGADVYSLRNAASEASPHELSADQIIAGSAEKRSAEQAQISKDFRFTDIDYHLLRARTERDVAYRSANAFAADAHMRLSALHLQRALLLRTVAGASTGNIHPFRPSKARR